MASNDEVVLGMPQIVCPSCRQLLDLSRAQIDKLSKGQRAKKRQGETPGGSYTAAVGGYPRLPEDNPSEMPERNFVIVTCGNDWCEQYNKIKVLELPRIVTPSVRVEL